jgi:cytochrome b6-f complex iron-sulfur subunit
VKENNSRRRFISVSIKGGFLALLASIFYPVYKFIFPPEREVANVTQVKLNITREGLAGEPQRSKLFKFGRTLGIVFLTESGELKALSATCTHLDCTVQFRPDLSIIWCACHNGKYDLNGKNISGPPPKPLQQFAVNEVDGAIFVSKETA